ncbi:MAG: PadR family transcriptional regulator [Candidatus Wallbacteria bacterium]|nr:PadR family transcriptional regulator [Candidatus Wallbacteria bacterium]
MTRPETARLTTPDLVVLSLLLERPMHGYEMVRELERREVEDWAGISRAQVYYSLAKLARLQLLHPSEPPLPATVSGSRKGRGPRPAPPVPAGPDRIVYSPAASARRALARALAAEDWSLQRPPPPFLTWLCLSLHATPATVRAQIARRRRFLAAQIAKEEKTLLDIRRDKGPLIPIALAVVELAIRQFQLELSWLTALPERLRPSRGGP